jgi:hypothetical protein
MTDIIVLAGAKQSGKSSSGNFLTGYTLSQISKRNPGLPIPNVFDINNDGQLLVNSSYVNSVGEEVVGNGILDLSRRDYDFAEYAGQYIWPYIKIYNFADTLKDVCMHVFGLTYEQCYGSNDDKNTMTNIPWYGILSMLPRKEKWAATRDSKTGKNMTAREFMQFFGTQICRSIYDDCWIDSCFRRIEAENPAIAVITDCRFPNEVKVCRDKGAKIIKLTLDPFGDTETHDSETLLKDMPDSEFDWVLDNSKMTIIEKNQAILDKCYDWGIFKGHID